MSTLRCGLGAVRYSFFFFRCCRSKVSHAVATDRRTWLSSPPSFCCGLLFGVASVLTVTKACNRLFLTDVKPPMLVMFWLTFQWKKKLQNSGRVRPRRVLWLLLDDHEVFPGQMGNVIPVFSVCPRGCSPIGCVLHTSTGRHLGHILLLVPCEAPIQIQHPHNRGTSPRCHLIWGTSGPDEMFPITCSDTLVWLLRLLELRQLGQELAHSLKGTMHCFPADNKGGSKKKTDVGGEKENQYTFVRLA